MGRKVNERLERRGDGVGRRRESGPGQSRRYCDSNSEAAFYIPPCKMPHFYLGPTSTRHRLSTGEGRRPRMGKTLLPAREFGGGVA